MIGICIIAGVQSHWRWQTTRILRQGFKTTWSYICHQVEDECRVIQNIVDR
jgi:hypothetical protein